MKNCYFGLITTLLSLISLQAFAQPANDNCNNAQNIVVPTPPACPNGNGATTTVSGTNVGATPDNPYVYQTACNPGGPMATFQNDVWYSFTATGYQAIINIGGGTLTGINVAVWQGTCGNLTGRGCATTTTNNVTLTVEQLVIGQTYYIQVSGNSGNTGTFNLTIDNNIDCNDCLSSATLTANPPPVNGSYQPGQIVQFCFKINQWNEINTNWLHGVQFSWGSGWNAAPIATTPPAEWGGNNTGSWGWYTSCTSTATGQTFGQGFYWDTNDAGTNPGNNFGDAVAAGSGGTVPPGVWNFCVTLQVAPGCAPGSNLSVTVNTTGDGESGSWSSLGCADDPPTIFTAVGACCPPTMSATAPTCVGVNNGTATATPVGGGGPFNYQWSNGQTATGMAGAHTATGLAPGVYTVTITNATNCAVTATVNVPAATPFTATATNSGPICAGQSANISTPTAGTSYLWSNGATTASVNVTPATTTTYTVTVTNSGGCTATASTTVTVNTAPTVNITPAAPVICAGQSTTLTASGGGTYSWNTGASTPGITVSPGTTTTYTVTVTGTGGCTTTMSRTVTVNPLPTPTAGNNGPICAGATLNLTSSGGTSYSWSGPSGYTSTAQNPSITGATTANSGTYTVIVTSAAGCSASATTNVTVNPLPTPTAGNNGPICAGATLNLTSSGGTSYSWSGPSGYTSTAQNPSIAGATTANSGTYTVTVTSAAGCSASATTNVTVNPLPTPTAGNNGPICAGATLNLTSSGGTSYSWSGPSGYTNTAQNPSIAGATTANSGTYTVTVTSAAGCSASATTNVTVNPLPTPTAGNNGPICAGATLNLTSSGGTSYSWSGPSGYTSTTQNPSIAGATTANSGIYTVTVTSAAGCSASATTNVTVNPLPTPIAGNNGPICAGATLNLTSSGGTSYSWSGPSGYTSTAQNPSIAGATTANSGIYTVTVTSAAGCSASATTNVTVNPLPTPTAGNNGPICAGATLNLTSSGGTSYSWSGPSGYTSTAQNPSITGATTANSGTYTVIVTSAAGCSASATTNVTVNPLPTPTAGNNGPICAGATLNLTSSGGASYSWTGPGGYTSTAQNPTIPGATFANTGIYTVTITSAAGCSVTATTNVTVNPLPTPTANNNGPLCPTNTLNLTSTGGANYQWIGPNGFTSTAQNPSIPGITLANAGTYTVTVTSGAGCTASTSTVVTIAPNLAVSASSNSPVCAGGTLNLTTSGGVSYSWAGPSGYSSIAQNPSITNVTGANSGIYTVTVTDANGCSGTATVNVSINPLPIPNAGNNGPICAGQTLNLNASGGTGYSWTGPNGFTNNTQNPSISNVTTAAGGTYTVTVTDANGCSATTTTSVTINPLPTPTAGNNGPICQGTTLNLTSSGGTGYSWSGPNGFTNNTQNPSIANASVAASGTYTVTVTSAAGCSATATTSVTVNPLPTPTAGNNGPICTGATLNLTSSGGTGYSWSGPNGFTNNTQNPSITNATVAASGTYTVTVTSVAGCSATATTSVTVNPLPTAIANNDGPICEGNTFNIIAGGGVSYSWTGPANYTSTQQNNSFSNAQPNQGGTYTVTVTDNNGCISTASTTVIVNVLPVATANAGGPACEGSTISLSATGGTTYQWTGPNAFSSTSQNPNISGATTSNNGTYTVTVTDANGCSSTASTTITVYAIPIASFSATNLSGCTPVCTDFTDLSTVNGSTITSWSWSSNGTNFSNQQNPTQCFSNTGLYDINLTVTSAQGCSATIVFNDLIQVFPNPIADFFINPDLIFSSNPVAQFINASSGNITSWNWNFGDGNTSSIENPTHIYSDTGEFCVTLTVISANGCQASTQNCLYIYPEYVIYIPNTFTPNDDKLNDYFAVEGQGIKSIEMYIFNRWGESIYSTDNLQGWPGFIRNTSEIAKQDVYVYKIYVTDILDGKHEYYGHVNLLR